MALENDIDHVAKVYGLYFSHVHVDSATLTLCLETAEKETLRISVSAAGWSVAGDPKRYETFEALLSTKSPGFRAVFASNLAGRLEALASERSGH